MAIIADQLATIAGEWTGVCEAAILTETDRKLFAGRQFLNRDCVDGLGADHDDLRERFEAARARLVG
ncbi:hypothetical protein [Tropicimonas sp. IMCC34043]|uniref:hypothetical protein n=1 Tax=Tropicimonas sp. IMCC34043 TaxID=2248760 RepID=UPI001300203B|nr:hypothetical protein [Tropicimonas sp. IMCC34043]